MKAFATIGLGPLGSISFQHSIHTLPADRPHGVAPDAWIRLDEKLGLVLAARRPAGGALGGCFMVKQAGMWQRLVDDSARAGLAGADREPSECTPAPATQPRAD
jgi:hypothetical protein